MMGFGGAIFVVGLCVGILVSVYVRSQLVAHLNNTSNDADLEGIVQSRGNSNGDSNFMLQMLASLVKLRSHQIDKQQLDLIDVESEEGDSNNENEPVLPIVISKPVQTGNHASSDNKPVAAYNIIHYHNNAPAAPSASSNVPNRHSVASSLVSAGIVKPKKAASPASVVTHNFTSVVPPQVLDTNVEDPNIFLPIILQLIKGPTDFVAFNGRNVKQIWGEATAAPQAANGQDSNTQSDNALLELTGKTKARNWGDVAVLMKEILDRQQQSHYWNKTSSVKAMHIHNEHKLGSYCNRVWITMTIFPLRRIC
jgi:hypothetical protein